ncbi:S-layer homology domain-containing protein [Bacillus tuaregi]|uniref:S-layer homology domain-containing protein n=1 Tax=Bacillus tuaregi TaxID=1816695 RepID=UPI0008F7F5C0|nr:S-layer homology domain-containing protein [Bacillus tuaregi]
MYQFKKHVVQEQENQLVISLYLDIPNVEFAAELGKSQNEHEDLEKSAKSYIKSKFPNLKNATVKIMAGGMLVSTLALGAASLSPQKAGAEANDAINPPSSVVAQEDTTGTPTGGDGDGTVGDPTDETDGDETAADPTDGTDEEDTTAGDSTDGTDDEDAIAGDPTDETDEEAAVGDTDDAAGDTVVSFKDTGGTYFTEPVEVLVEKGVVKGVNDDHFAPYREVTRAEAAAMLARALNLDTEGTVTDPGFNDVSANSDFYKTIAALADKDIISGYDDGSFKPNQKITRAELAKMIAGTFTNIEVDENAETTFTDVGQDSTFKNYIAAIHEAGITKGSTDDTFEPYKNTRRAEAATMIYRSINVDLFGQADGLVPIEDISDTAVTVNGTEFSLSNDLKELINLNNKTILEDAVVYLSTDKEDTVQKIRYLEIKNSGTEGSPLVLEGGDTVIHGPLIISGDYLSINGLTVKGDTTINGTASEVAAAATDTTTGTNITIKDSKLGAVAIKGTVNFVTEGSTITKLTIEKASTKVTLDEAAKIGNLVIPAGMSAGDIIENYDSVKQNIEKVNDEANEDAGDGDNTGTTPGDGDNNGQDPDPVFDENQFIYDVNVTEGEGNLRDLLLELNHGDYADLSEAQQTEVAKLFLVQNETTVEDGERTKGLTSVDEIEDKLGAAITTYNQLLGGVNEASDVDGMKTALGGIASLFDLTVDDAMAQKVLDSKADTGYPSVTSIMDVLQADTDDEGEDPTTDPEPDPTLDENQFIYDVNVTEGEGNLRDLLLELNHGDYADLSEAQQTEVAKLFLVQNETTVEDGERTKGLTSVDEIEDKLGAAITTYNQLLGGVNEASDVDGMKTALGGIASLFDLTVDDAMASKVLDSKGDTGYPSVTSIMDVLQADTDDEGEDPTTDTTAPELLEVTPESGTNVNLDHDKNFTLTVKAQDENLRELEVDHNLTGLPEFSVYASEENPYGSADAKKAFEEQGVIVTYNAETQTWTIDFGETVTDAIVNKGNVTFHTVLRDEAGNSKGSMDPTTADNTFTYTVTQNEAPAP